MYPILFEIYGFPISTFGLMMAAGFLVGTAILSRRFRELGYDPDLATTMLVYTMLGGVLGSKLYFAIDVSLREGQPFLSLLLARDGITWFGGLIGGAFLGILGSRFHGIPPTRFANAAAPALPVGQALGRIGCFLVGDDYGHPTDLPWGVAFPEGAPPTLVAVHPTQLYECAWLLLAGALLWRRRDRSPFLVAEYGMLAGIGRFFVEIWRVNPRVAGGLTEAQWIAIAIFVAGAIGWLIARRRASP